MSLLATQLSKKAVQFRRSIRKSCVYLFRGGAERAPVEFQVDEASHAPKQHVL